jgi:cytosine deaminase
MRHDPLAAPLPRRLVLGAVSVPASLADRLPPGLPADADGISRVDLEIADGRIAGLTAAGRGAPAIPRLELGGRLALPCFVDMHTHLDKGHIWPRAANPDGGFMSALATVDRDRVANWRAADVRARMEFGLRCAWAHGTAAIRTHVDSIAPQAEISWPVLAELRERWAGRIELQGVSLAMLEDYRGSAGARLADMVAAHGGVLGVVPLMQPGLDEDLDRLVGLAAERGLDIDCHIDETGDPASRTLWHLAQAALRHRFRGRIVAGHCCSLAVQPADEARATLDLVAAAAIAIVSLPMCNLYLQDRAAGRTPRWRGVTLLHEIRARGIPLAVASDNTRDPFYAYGDLDMHEVLREAVRIGHLDHPIGDWPRAVTATPAEIMGLAGRGRIAVGARADLVILEGRSWSEALSRPESRRTVLRAGQPIDTTPPAYAELDPLLA